MEIIIHVSDDARRISRDFYCSRALLLSHMRYFAPYLTVDRGHDEIDISVHCDIDIFEWLVEYMHHPSKPPLMEPASVLSILISAEFLQMTALVKLCIQFVREHINEVVRLPLDMSCVSDESVSQLATLIDPADMERIKDKKDKIISRLYNKKIAQLMSLEENALFKCAFCQKLFTAGQKDWETCSRAPSLIDFHGKAICEHVANRSWDPHKWLSSLQRSKQGGVREAFWRLWGLTHSLSCSLCGIRFPVCELDHCIYHPQEPHFEPGENHGTYPCCGQNALRFDPAFAKRRGCLARRHVPDFRPRLGTGSSGGASQADAAALLEVALSHAEVVLVPFEGLHDERRSSAQLGPSGSAAHGGGSVTAIDADGEGYGEGSGNPTPITSRPQRSSASAGAQRGRAASGERRAPCATNSDDGSSSDDDRSDDGVDSDGTSDRSDDSDVLSDSSVDSPREPKARGRSADGKTRGASGAGINAALQRGVQLDTLIFEDENRMDAICRAIEQRRGPPRTPREPPPAALAGPKPTFLDHRQIRHVSRSGGNSVVWPRSCALNPTKEAAREGRRSIDGGVGGSRVLG